MLQGPCFENQRALIEFNLVASLNKILRWTLNNELYFSEVSSSVSITSRTKLVKMRISRYIDETNELDFSAIEEKY